MLFSLLTEFQFSLNSLVTAPFPPHLNSLSLSPLVLLQGYSWHTFTFLPLEEYLGVIHFVGIYIR